MSPERSGAAGDFEDQLAGVIAAASDPPGLSKRAWRELTNAMPALRPTGDEDAADVIVDGAVVGKLRWSTSAREIDVFGPVDALSDVAWNVAARLDGHFVTLAELTSC